MTCQMLLAMIHHLLLYIIPLLTRADELYH